MDWGLWVLSGFRSAVYLEFKMLAAVLAYVVAVFSIGFIQSKFLPILLWAISSRSLILLALCIAYVNLLAALLLAVTSHTIFNVLTPLHLSRCSIAYTPDCRFTRLLSNRRLEVSLALFPLLVVELMVGSMTRLGLPVTLDGLVSVLVYGLTNTYGVLELSGYMVAYLTPVLRRWWLSVLVVTLISIGALVEAKLVVG